jgi:cytochrome c oxidase cbb3-type subunit 3
MTIVLAILVLSSAAIRGQTTSLPDAPGRDTVQRVCGTCHPATIVLGHGMTREGWGQVVATMITRGAKGSPADFETVTDYLARTLPAKQSGGAARRGPSLSAGPNDRQTVDPAAAERGKAIYMADCSSCHGPLARGSENGPDLVRSEVVLHDRYGSTIGLYLLQTHPKTGSARMTSLTQNQIKDLAHFLHEQVEDTLRSGPYTKVLNVMTGDAQAGAAYFQGNGGCAGCHSITGDLAGIASRYDPPTLQQRMLFPRTIALGRRAATGSKPLTVKVTSQDGESISGTLVHMDDFTVSLRDETGTYHSWRRTPQLNLELHDPYAAHEELLDRISDKDIHNLVAYLETLK